jgi:hypothetical protein
LELLHLPARVGQLLKMPLSQPLFLVSQLLRLGSQGIFLEGDGELAVEEVYSRLPQAIMLNLHDSLANVKVDSMGHEITTLTFEHVGDLFFLLLQPLLPLSRLLLLLGDDGHTPIEVLLQLDISISMGLDCSMEFLGILQ